MSDDTPLRKRLRSYFTTGLILMLPVFFTLFILSFAFGFVTDFLSPVSSEIQSLLSGNNTSQTSIIAEVVALIAITSSIFVVGFLAKTVPTEGQVADVFHAAVESIPGVGSVYGGVRQMGETMASGEESFREVKLVEYPTQGSYTLAFVTGDTPDIIEQSTGVNGMQTLFLPMGPNPVMGGFTVYVPEDRIHDIDISVEEGIQAVITSGVTLNEGGGPEQGSLRDELEDLHDAFVTKRDVDGSEDSTTSED